MYMPYTTNPHLPRLRMQTVRLVRSGWSIRKAARHIGVHPSTVMRWAEKAPRGNVSLLETLSSRPLHHPHELGSDMVRAIIDYRIRYRRCAEVIHHLLLRDGVIVSLSSVKRTLRRNHLTYPSKWKKWHTYPPRPLPEKPGILVEIDTVVLGSPEERFYVYTLLDVCTRWAQAMAVVRNTNHASLRFVDRVRPLLPFSITTLQSDHGAEFSKWFTKQVVARGMAHRHSRVRTPSDNGHLERFNRTIQEECLNRMPRRLHVYQKEIPAYIDYYNRERPHMALEMQTPAEVLRSY